MPMPIGYVEGLQCQWAWAYTGYISRRDQEDEMTANDPNAEAALRLAVDPNTWQGLPPEKAEELIREGLDSLSPEQQKVTKKVLGWGS
jgi:hypothetical protein